MTTFSTGLLCWVSTTSSRIASGGLVSSWLIRSSEGSWKAIKKNQNYNLCALCSDIILEQKVQFIGVDTRNTQRKKLYYVLHVVSVIMQV